MKITRVALGVGEDWTHNRPITIAEFLLEFGRGRFGIRLALLGFGVMFMVEWETQYMKDKIEELSEYQREIFKDKDKLQEAGMGEITAFTEALTKHMKEDLTEYMLETGVKPDDFEFDMSPPPKKEKDS